MPEGLPQTCASFVTPIPKGSPGPAIGPRSLRQDHLQSFSDCRAEGPPNRNRLPAARHLCLYGASRRLRQRYASGLVERNAHDRVAVVFLVIVFVVMRAVFLYHRAIIGRRAYRVLVSRIYKRTILSYVL